MRPLKIFSLLFSLAQFILILKLIELVRGGNPDPSSNFPISQENDQDQDQDISQERSFYLAPSKVKQKKYRLWGTTTPEVPTTDANLQRLGLDGDGEEYAFEPVHNSTAYNSTVISVFKQDKKNSTHEQSTETEGRLCPGCASGVCGGSLATYGFPVIPVVVAIIVGVIWFFVFLFIWYFASETTAITTPTTTETLSGAYGSPMLDYIQGSGAGGVSQRSWNTFNQLTPVIIDALVDLAKRYNA